MESHLDAAASAAAVRRLEVVRLTYSVEPGYSELVLRTFHCRNTERLWKRERVGEFESIAAVALRRLTALDSARVLTDLSIPPGNRLEALQGDRQGQHSIRINDKYRICFTWKEENAHDVEITKHYH